MRRDDYLAGSRRVARLLRPHRGHPRRPVVGGAAYRYPLSRCHWPDDGWGGRRQGGGAVIGLRIEPRYEVSRVMVYSMPVLAVALTLAVGIGLLATCSRGIDVWAALYHCFIARFQ